MTGMDQKNARDERHLARALAAERRVAPEVPPVDNDVQMDDVFAAASTEDPLTAAAAASTEDPPNAAGAAASTEDTPNAAGAAASTEDPLTAAAAASTEDPPNAAGASAGPVGTDDVRWKKRRATPTGEPFTDLQHEYWCVRAELKKALDAWELHREEYAQACEANMGFEISLKKKDEEIGRLKADMEKLKHSVPGGIPDAAVLAFITGMGQRVRDAVCDLKEKINGLEAELASRPTVTPPIILTAAEEEERRLLGIAYANTIIEESNGDDDFIAAALAAMSALRV